MSNKKSKIMIFFVILSLVFNFNLNGYASTTEIKKIENDIYILDKTNNFNFDLNQYNKITIPFSELVDDTPEYQILLSQVSLGYLSGLLGYILGGLFFIVSAGIYYVISVLFKDNFTSEFRSKLTVDNGLGTFYFGLFTYLSISFLEALTINKIGKDNYDSDVLFKTFGGGILGVILYFATSFAITYVESETKKYPSENFSKPENQALFLLVFPLYLAIVTTISYHLTKKTKTSIANNEKIDLEELAEMQKNIIKVSSSIKLENNNIKFNLLRF